MKKSRGYYRILIISTVIAVLLISGSLLWVSLRLDERTYAASEVSKMILVVEFANVLAFLIVVVAFLGILLRSLSYERINERFTQVNRQSDTIVFEYDYLKNCVEYGGNYKRFFPQGKSHAQDEHMWDLLNLLHPDDVGVREAIFNIPWSKDNEISGEARFKCGDGEYYWYRIKGKVLRDASGSALKFIGDIANAEDQVNEEIRLKQAAEQDPLTGILNKGAMENHTEEILGQSSGSESYALYIIDLDNFKKVNDTLGHAVGDKVLADVARKMSVVFSEQDCIGRIGGDEFCVFLRLTGIEKEKGRKVIENKAAALCERISETYSNGKADVKISASIGVSIYPEHGTTFGKLYRNADAALYKAKNAGKNRFEFFAENA